MAPSNYLNHCSLWDPRHASLCKFAGNENDINSTSYIWKWYFQLFWCISHSQGPMSEWLNFQFPQLEALDVNKTGRGLFTWCHKIQNRKYKQHWNHKLTLSLPQHYNIYLVSLATDKLRSWLLMPWFLMWPGVMMLIGCVAVSDLEEALPSLRGNPWATLNVSTLAKC